MVRHEYREQGPPCDKYCERCDASMVVVRVIGSYANGEVASLTCWPNERFGPMARIEFINRETRRDNVVLGLRCPAVWEVAMVRLGLVKVGIMAGIIEVRDDKYKGQIDLSVQGDPIGWVDKSGEWHYGLYGGTRSDSEIGGVTRPVLLTPSERIMTTMSSVIPPEFEWYNFRELFPLPNPGTGIRK